jgi:hypothetical protein
LGETEKFRREVLAAPPPHPSAVLLRGDSEGREKIMLYCKGLFNARNDDAEARRFNRSLIEA